MSYITAAAHRAALLRIRIRLRLRRLSPRWLALTTLLMAVTLTPQALAEPCTQQNAATPIPELTLNANQWRMVGIPCVPAGILTPFTATVGNVFLGSALLTAANYANANSPNGWVLWKRNYAATGDSYSQMAVTDVVTNGGAYWLYTKSGGSFQVNGTRTPSSTNPVITSYGAQKPATDRYIMYASPWARNQVLNFSSLLWSGLENDVLTNNQTTAAVTGSVPPLVSAEVSYWNGNTYFTYSLTSNPAATFPPYQAAWIKVFPPPVGVTVTNTTIKAPRP